MPMIFFGWSSCLLIESGRCTVERARKGRLRMTRVRHLKSMYAFSRKKQLAYGAGCFHFSSRGSYTNGNVMTSGGGKGG